MASTGVRPEESAAFRRNTMGGKTLTATEREEMLKKYLPPDPLKSEQPAKRRRRESRAHLRKRQGRGIIRHSLHVFIYTVVHFFFSIFFRFRRAWRLTKIMTFNALFYHHRTPEFIRNDVKKLERLPKHLSVILDFHEGDEEQGTAGIEGLLQDVCDIAAWTACAGIPNLSIYEKSGKLKHYIPQTHKTVSATLESYYGSQRKPTLSIRAPHQTSYSPPLTPPRDTTSPGSSDSESTDPKHERAHLNILLLSAEDGRDTMVDLTRTLADMAQNGTLHPEQINAQLIDAELCEAVSDEPDLLILFSPTVVLKGFPPWQLRLTEIFHMPDNKGVNYQVYLRALYKYAKAEMRLGR